MNFLIVIIGIVAVIIVEILIEWLLKTFKILPKRPTWGQRIFVIVITVVLVILAAWLLLINDMFIYQIRVQKEGTNLGIANAIVTIEIPDQQAPLNGITDANGFARIFIAAAYVGKPGRLLVKADGYDPYRQEIDLRKNILPDTVQLKPITQVDKTPFPTLTPTATATAPPTSTLTPTNTLSSIATLTPTPIPHPPRLVAERLWYALNDGTEQSVQREGIIQVALGDRLCLVRLEYSPIGTPGPSDTAHGEAYVRKPEIPFDVDEGFDSNDGVFWIGDPVSLGTNELTQINIRINDGCWIIGEGWDRLVVALVHNGLFGWEVDHRFFANLLPSGTPTASSTPSPTPEKIAILTYHNKYVTAYDDTQDWALLAKAVTISDCEKFTVHWQDNNQIALETCHGRYVTAPQDQQGLQAKWLLKSELELDECGVFTQTPLGEDKYAFVTCGKKYVTAMDDLDDVTGYAWNWALRAETMKLFDWEKFTLIQIQE